MAHAAGPRIAAVHIMEKILYGPVGECDQQAVKETTQLEGKLLGVAL